LLHRCNKRPSKSSLLLQPKPILLQPVAGFVAGRLFGELWLLQPGYDDNGEQCPELLRIGGYEEVTVTGLN
jgi:hypothetical protein